jgi:hypothetical protein
MATPKFYQEHARFLLGAHGKTYLREYNYFNLVVCHDYVASVRRGSTSTTSCTATTRLRPQQLYINDVVCCEYSSPSRSGFTSTTQRVRVPRLLARLVVDYSTYVARSGASARRAARRRILRLRRATECLRTSRGSSRRSSSTTSPTPCDRVPRHVTRLVTKLVIDYFTYAMRPGASARHAARCRLLRLRRTSGCLGSSRGSLCRSSLTTSSKPRDRVPRYVTRLVTRLVVDYFAYAARTGATSSPSSSSTTSPHAGSSSTTSTMLCVRVPRLVTRLVTSLVVDYFAYAVRPGASARRVTRCRLLRLRLASGCLGTSRGSSCRSLSTTPCAATLSCGHIGSTSATDYLSRGNTGSTSSMLRAAATSSSGRIVSTIHFD